MSNANKLTILRILLVPAFMYFFFANFAGSALMALLVFIIASLTDYLDGYVARKYNQITSFGKLIDPLADKPLITAALVCFVERGYITSWIAVLIISREFIVTGLRILAISENVVIAANNWGKVKTISQIVMIIMILVLMHYCNFTGFYTETIIFSIEIIAAGLTLYSGVDYIIRNSRLINLDKS